MTSTDGSKTKSAVLGLGCFWAPDSIYGATKGVIRTKVGFSGGTTPNPTYRSIGDHTEVIQIDYDPSLITYEQLLNIFWNHHDPTIRNKDQYRSLILWMDDEQKVLGDKSIQAEQQKSKRSIVTVIAPFKHFYDAEDYHQKYRLRQHKWLISAVGLKEEDFKTSHVATRLNGYLAGCGGVAQFEQEAKTLGLNDEAKAYVLKSLKQNEGSGPTCG